MIHFLHPETDLTGLLDSARQDGRETFVVDAGEDLESSIAEFGEALRFPHWFGHNLDALFDCLREFREGDDRPTTIVWDHIRALRRAHPQSYEAVLGVLDDVTGEREDVDVHIVQR